jgi:hypothetical protein
MIQNGWWKERTRNWMKLDEIGIIRFSIFSKTWRQTIWDISFYSSACVECHQRLSGCPGCSVGKATNTLWQGRWSQGADSRISPI